MKYNVGIVAPAHNISPNIIKSFENSIHDSNPDCTYTIEIIKDSKQLYPTFNKSVALNHGIKKLIDNCEVIITADVDQLIAPNMIDISYRDRDKLVHIMSRDLGEFDGTYYWDKWKDIKIREGCWGAWLSMSSDNWKKIGGFNEYMWGWGWEDVDLLFRVQNHGIDVAIYHDFPYMHLHHKYREYRANWIGRNSLNAFTSKTVVPENWIIDDQPGKLPEFVIIGAQKSGTSAAVNNLDLHPDVFMTSIKSDNEIKRETHFFDALWFKGTGWYKSLFQTELLAGEKTAMYLHTHDCHQRIFNTIPHAKLIILLRDPVRRAFSAWNQGADDGWDNNLYKNCDFDTVVSNHLDCGIIMNGRYIESITNLLKYYPKDQIHIEISEHVMQDMEGAYNRIYDFLGIDRIKDPGYMCHHVRTYHNTYTDHTRDKLYEYYAPLNERLFEFLGFEIPEWDSSWTDPLH